MCYYVYGMMHIKEPLLLIGKSSPCGGSGIPLSLSGIIHIERKEGNALLNVALNTFYLCSMGSDIW